MYINIFTHYELIFIFFLTLNYYLLHLKSHNIRFCIWHIYDTTTTNVINNSINFLLQEVFECHVLQTFL